MSQHRGTGSRPADAPVLLNAILILYIAIGPLLLGAAVLRFLVGAPLTARAVALTAVLAVSISGLSYAALKRKAWGYWGVFVLGSLSVYRSVQAAHALGWRDGSANLSVAFMILLFAPVVLHMRLHLRKPSG